MPHACCHQVTIEHTIDAPVSEVFDAWVTPESRGKWFAPAGMVSFLEGGAIRPGAREKMMVRTASGVHLHEITYCEIMTPVRISYRCDIYEGAHQVSAAAVVVTFEDAGGRTLLRITEDIVPVARRAGGRRPDFAVAAPFVAPKERLVARGG